MYNQLITKLSAIVTKISSTNGLDSDRQGVEKKIVDVDENITNTIGLVEENDYNTKLQILKTRYLLLLDELLLLFSIQKLRRLKIRYLISQVYSPRLL